MARNSIICTIGAFLPHCISYFAILPLIAYMAEHNAVSVCMLYVAMFSYFLVFFYFTIQNSNGIKHLTLNSHSYVSNINVYGLCLQHIKFITMWSDLLEELSSDILFGYSVKIEIIRFVKFYAYRIQNECSELILCLLFIKIKLNHTQGQTVLVFDTVILAYLHLLRVSLLNMFICVPCSPMSKTIFHIHFRHDKTNIVIGIFASFSLFMCPSLSFLFHNDNNWPAAILSRLAAFYVQTIEFKLQNRHYYIIPDLGPIFLFSSILIFTSICLFMVWFDLM